MFVNDISFDNLPVVAESRRHDGEDCQRRRASDDG